MTDLPKNKQALAVSLSLNGNAKRAAMGIEVEELNTDEGMSNLINVLDNLFLKDSLDSMYEAYKNFDKFQRPENMSISEYIIEFDQRYLKSTKFEMTLPDAVLAFKLLDKSGLDYQQRQLALTACASSELKYKNMKSALKRIFGESNVIPSNEEPIVKQETALYATTSRKQKSRNFPRSDTGKSNRFRNGNPTNRYGKVTKCSICQSVLHWWRECPHKSEAVRLTETDELEHKETEMEECNITLLSHDEYSPSKIFLVESLNMAVIDTACTRTVCGQRWLDEYKKNINQEDIIIKRSNRPFRFGDGKIINSSTQVTLPAIIGSTRCNISAEVIQADIPLLLSKASLKRAGAVLDLNSDKAVMFGKPVDLQFTSSGHYCVDILGSGHHTRNSHSDVLIVDNMTNKEKIKSLEKLHRQFGHASAEKLKLLLKSAGSDVVEVAKILEKIVANCEICRKYRKPAPRPVVGFSLANDYNHTVAMDLHQLEPNLWYLHIIDEFSRFSAGCITNTKQSSKIVKKFIQCWISIHGAPKRMFSDLGGEFDNAEMKDMAENFNIDISTTAAYSPWSNGLLERHNQILTEILLKLRSDYTLDWETALNWAIMAKNSLQNVHGYSPYQIVFGRNPNIPTILIDKPPALEGTTTSEVVKNNINGLHAARQAFIKAESSEKIRRALRKQTRPTPDLCSPEDKVYYKRPDNQEWKGPGVVIGQDGPVVFVRHGGMLVRVHKCRLRLCNSPLADVNSNEISVASKTSDSQDYNYETSDEEYTETAEVGTKNDPQPDPIAKIKPGNIITYNQKGSNGQIQAEIISRAGKATGRNKHWFNVKIQRPVNLENEEMSVDLSKVTDLNVAEPLIGPTEGDTIMMVAGREFDEAKKRELDSWKQNNVFTEIDDAGQKCISTRWVCSLKNTPNGVMQKARLVARGFEEPKNDIQKDSPTCAHESLRLIMALTAQNQWSLHSIDIKTAFLQGHTMDREVYIRPPKEAFSDKIWRLNKCVYGLSDASLQWYNKVKSVMIENGGVMSQMDPTVFYWISKSGNLAGVLACHVDDFIWSGDQTFNNTISKIRSAFKIGKEDSKAFKYCGIELNCYGPEILINQNKYTDYIIHSNRLLKDHGK